MSEPIPFFPDLSYAVHPAHGHPGGLADEASRTRRGPILSVVLAHGRLGFNEVMSLPPRPGDPGDGADRVSRFADYVFGAMDDSTTAWTAAPSAGVTEPVCVTGMSTSPDIPFAVDDDLPERGLAIEASAGTGKTYALADLATRYLAESDISAIRAADRHLHPGRHQRAPGPGPRATDRGGGPTGARAPRGR